MISESVIGKVKGRVTIFLIILNVAAILSIYVALKERYGWSIREAETHSQNVALAVDLNLSSEVSKINLSLLTVANEVSFHKPEYVSVRNEHLVELVKGHFALLPEAEGWTITDAEGKIIYNETPIGHSNFSIEDREYFQELKSGPEPRLIVTKPLKSRATGNSIILFARSFYSLDKIFLGIVAVPIPISYLNEIISIFDVGKRGFISLNYKTGETITSFPSLETMCMSSNVYNDICKKSLRNERPDNAHDAFHSELIFDQSKVICSSRELNNAPIIVSVGLLREDELEDWRNALFISLVFLGSFLVIVNVAVVMLYLHWKRRAIDSKLLQESNERLEESLESLKVRDKALIAAEESGQLGTYTLDIMSKSWTCSRRLDMIFGIGSESVHSIETWEKLLHPEDRIWMTDYFYKEVIGKCGIFDQVYRIVRPEDNQTIWVHGLGKLELNKNGVPIYMSGTIQDITLRKSADDRLQLAHDVFQNMTEGIVVLDTTGTILETNPAFSQITGYSSQEVKGKQSDILKSDNLDKEFYEQVRKELFEKGVWEGHFKNKRKDGVMFTQKSRLLVIKDQRGEIIRIVVVIQDITELEESQQRLEHLAYHDALTGLPNRALLADRMNQAMALCRREKGHVLGLCCLDLDGFKDVNDIWGHEIGDQLLSKVAKRLLKSVRTNDTVARLGGDEFIVLLTNQEDEFDIREAILRIQEVVGGFFEIDAVTHQISMSVGVTLYPNDSTNEPDVLLRQADQAMYEAKRNGKNQIHFFDSESERRLSDYIAKLKELRAALELEQFVLYYQPKVNLNTGEVIGVEALIRWLHPEKGLIPPGMFLPDIENTELTSSLGEWIIGQALKQRQAWLHEGLNIEVSVNVFGLHLQRDDFVERVESIIQSYSKKVSAGLEFEVVETTALKNLEQIIGRIEGCKKLGINFSLDDFGTGYSSLTYMRRLPVGTIKIDRSFVSDMLQNEDDRVLVESIVRMAHILNRKVVAEGVENAEQGVALKNCGCDYLQGFYIAKPLPPEDVSDWVRTWRLPESWM